MPEKSYGFAIGNLRARENTLMNRNDMVQLVSLDSVDELADALRDKGFGDRISTGSVPKLLQTARVELWNYLNEIAPDSKIFEPFLIENDFHNLKAILKSLIRNTDPQEYLLEPSVFLPETLKTAIREKKFELLPDELRDTADRAYGILTSGADAQLCDAVIDAACMKQQLSMVKAKGYKISLAAEIIRETVFYNTIKAALRSAKAQKDGAFLDETLVDTGIISRDALKAAALGGVEKVLELLRASGKSDAASAYEKSPSEFERYCDNAVMAVARKARFVTMGAEPVIGYYMAKKAEEKNVRIIYSAIKVGQPQEITMGRLRELYG